MHAHYILLSFYIHTLRGPSSAAATAEEVSVPSAQLLPEGFSAFGDYEILSSHTENDEDVVRMRKRVNDDCDGTDCLTYTSWDPKGVYDCREEDEGVPGDGYVWDSDYSSSDQPDSSDPDSSSHESESESSDEEKPGSPMSLGSKRSNLEKRAKTGEPPCVGVKVDGVAREGIPLMSPGWVSTAVLLKRYPTRELVYDTGNPTKPEELAWYQLKRSNAKWSKDSVGRKVNQNSGNRCYDTEHVLEWQLLKTFIDSDKDKGDQSLCVHLYKYFLETFLEKKPTVKVAKNNGEIDKTTKRFDYDDDVVYDFAKWGVKKIDPNTPVPKGKKGTPVPVKARIMDYIGFQWPGPGKARPPNPWEYELIVLNKDANMKKADIWIGNAIFPKTAVDGSNKLKTNQDQSETLEALYHNRYYESQTGKDWAYNKGKCAAVHKYTTAMEVAEYHNEPLVREILRAQVNRVGEAWKYLEELLEKNKAVFKPAKGNDEPFVKRDIRKAWREWMVDQHKLRLGDLQKALDDNLHIFKGESKIKTKIKRWDHWGIFRRVVEEPNCGTEPDDKIMKKREDMLVEAKGKLAKIDLVLKLD